MASLRLSALASLAGLVIAQDWIPDGLGWRCEGLIRPDWTECRAMELEWFLSREMQIGPGFLEGQTFTGENCQMRWLECGNKNSGWVEENNSYFEALADQCEDLGVGSVGRWGDLCILVEDPDNPFSDTTAALASIGAAPIVKTTVIEPEKPAPVTRNVQRSLTRTKRQQTCGERDDCFMYTETTVLSNVRGDQVRVCDDILPDGASCTKTKSTTQTHSYSIGAEISGKLASTLNAGVSFDYTWSEAQTVSLATSITIDCDGSSGYVVWYPLEMVSMGDCFSADCAENGRCLGENIERTDCSVRTPIIQGEGRLSGEYDVICI